VILPFGKLAAKVLAFPLLAFISGLSDLLPPGKGAATALAFSLLAFFYLLYLLLLGLLVVCGIVSLYPGPDLQDAGLLTLPARFF
jgi:hypothetical protein